VCAPGAEGGDLQRLAGWLVRDEVAPGGGARGGLGLGACGNRIHNMLSMGTSVGRHLLTQPAAPKGPPVRA